MLDDIEREVLIEAEPSMVFEALTDSELLVCWLCHEVEIEPKEGGRFRMVWRAMDEDRPLRYEGTAVIGRFEPGHLLLLQMLDGVEHERGSRVSFELARQGAATRLKLCHSGFEPTVHGERIRRAYERAWTSFLELLRSLLEDPPEQRLLMAALQRDLPVPGDEPCGLAWDQGKLWLSEASTGSIFCLDARSGRVCSSIEYDGEPADLAWDGSHLWQADTEKRALVKLDPSTGRIAATLRVPSNSGELAGLAWDGTGLWVSLCGDGSQILRLDARSGAMTSSRLADPGLSGLAWDGERLWAGDFGSRTVARLDPTSGQVLSRYALKGQPTGLAWDGFGLWYVDREWRLLSRLLDLGSASSDDG